MLNLRGWGYSWRKGTLYVTYTPDLYACINYVSPSLPLIGKRGLSRLPGKAGAKGESALDGVR